MFYYKNLATLLKIGEKETCELKRVAPTTRLTDRMKLHTNLFKKIKFYVVSIREPAVTRKCLKVNCGRYRS